MRKTAAVRRAWAVGMAWWGAFVAAPAGALTVGDLVPLVEGKNEEVRAAVKDQEAADAGVRAAWARLLPAVDLKANYIHLGADIQLQVPTQTFNVGMTAVSLTLPPVDLQKRDVFLSSLVVTWPLFTGGRIRAGIEAARGAREESEASRDKVTEEKIQDALVRYFGVQLARRSTDILEKMKMNLERIRGIADALVKSGLGAKFQTLQIQVAQAELESRLAEARGKASLADLAFKASTAQSPSSAIDYDSPLKKLALPASADAFVTRATEKRAEFALLRAKFRQVEALRAAKTGEMMPTLAAVGAVQLVTHNSPLLQPHWAVGLMLDVPISGWIGGLAERERAVKLGEKVELLEARAKRDVPLQVQKIYVETQASDASYQALEASEAMAAEALRLAEVRLKNGDGSALEVLRASTDYEKAQVQRQVLLEEFNRKLVDLYAASGDVRGYVQTYLAAEPGEKP